jgi:hypothetical protein
MVEVQVTSSGPGGPHLSPASGLRLKGARGSVPASGSIIPAPPAPSVIRSAFFRAAERLGEKIAAATSVVAGQDGCDAYEQDYAFFSFTHRMPFAGPRKEHNTEKTGQLEQIPNKTVCGVRYTASGGAAGRGVAPVTTAFYIANRHLGGMLRGRH